MKMKEMEEIFYPLDTSIWPITKNELKKRSHEPSAPTTARKIHFFIAPYYITFIVNLH